MSASPFYNSDLVERYFKVENLRREIETATFFSMHRIDLLKEAVAELAAHDPEALVDYTEWKRRKSETSELKNNWYNRTLKNRFATAAGITLSCGTIASMSFALTGQFTQAGISAGLVAISSATYLLFKKLDSTHDKAISERQYASDIAQDKLQDKGNAIFRDMAPDNELLQNYQSPIYTYN